jgi:glutamine amidotransferase
MGPNQGLGVFRGPVLRFAGTPTGGSPATSPPAQRVHRVPHIGWNQVHHCQNSPLLAGIPDGSYAYFVHSYYVVPEDEAIVLATTDYGLSYASIVGRGNIYGAQFHPEKSQEVGLQLLRNFVKIANRR